MGAVCAIFDNGRVGSRATPIEHSAAIDYGWAKAAAVGLSELLHPQCREQTLFILPPRAICKAPTAISTTERCESALRVPGTYLWALACTARVLLVLE